MSQAYYIAISHHHLVYQNSLVIVALIIYIHFQAFYSLILHALNQKHYLSLNNPLFLLARITFFQFPE